MAKIRKPLEPQIKEKLGENVSLAWLTCDTCGCEFEVTERAADKYTTMKITDGALVRCFECFDAGRIV